MEDQTEIAAVRDDSSDRILVIAADRQALEGFEGEVSSHGDRRLLVGSRNPHNLAQLRTRIPWLRPQPLGLRSAVGFGDRLGLATPGHVKAMRTAGQGLGAIFAQQSIREMSRTRRTPQEVLDDATWGVFAAGWRDGWGADADHLKAARDVDACASVGYTFYTFDPGDHVNGAADTLAAEDLPAALQRLPWDVLEESQDSLIERYRSGSETMAALRIACDEESVARSAVKYGAAVAHVALLFRRLEEVGPPGFEVEVSVDETDTPTTPLQHVFVATELGRLGVRWVSLAPRFVGRFEKGVDYIGDVGAFDADCAAHATIARRLGPYKLSLHSGSDKLSVYGAFRRHAGELAHLKTAGTSYLEALRTVARLEPGLFREIYSLARASYETDRASYHISASLEAAPAPETLADGGLPDVLEDFHARQVLHVTFGTVLETLGDRLLVTLRQHIEESEADLERHFVRHLEAFRPGAGGGFGTSEIGSVHAQPAELR
jgi:hypothetical protein